MVIERAHPIAPTEVGAAAIRLLAVRGYERTTAGELADAIGMSRSTFFRRFGSKDDVVFADHDLALRRLEDGLRDTELDTPDALTRAIAEVMQHLTHDAEAARLRSELLRQTPALRDRELVITHRYEQVCGDYLKRVGAPGMPGWVPVALASSVVAVHNAALRRWLRDPDPRIIGVLDTELRALIDLFGPWFGGATAGPTRVVVATFDAAAPATEVLQAISDQLTASR